MFLKHIACHGPLLRKKSHAYIFVICFQRYLYDLKYIIITILVLLLRFVKYLANIAFALRYSGFNFSHYDLPFPTRYCIPYVRSGLYQLVIRVKGFRVSAHDLDTHCMIRFCPSAWTPRFQRVESVSLAHGPRWLFLLSRHRKAFLLLLLRSLL